MAAPGGQEILQLMDQERWAEAAALARRYLGRQELRIYRHVYTGYLRFAESRANPEPPTYAIPLDAPGRGGLCARCNLRRACPVKKGDYLEPAAVAPADLPPDRPDALVMAGFREIVICDLFEDARASARG